MNQPGGDKQRELRGEGGGNASRSADMVKSLARNYDEWYFEQREKKSWHDHEHDETMGFGQQKRGFKVKNLPHPRGKNPGDVWCIPTAPFPGAHFACVDDETECLTKNGWKHHPQLKLSEQIATYSLKRDLVEWQPLEAVFVYPVKNQEMVSVERRDLSMLLTPNHRAVTKRDSGKIIIKRADQLSAYDRIPQSTNFPDPEIPLSLLDEELELIGWCITEGWLAGNGIRIAQVNKDGTQKLRELCKQIEGFVYSGKRDRTRKIGRKFHSWKEHQFRLRSRSRIRAIIGKLAPNLELSFTLVNDLSKHQCRVLFESMISGDGHRRADGRKSFKQVKSRKTLDAFQFLTMRLGFRAILSGDTVYVTEHDFIGLHNSKGSNIKLLEYTGQVWCPKTENTTFIARRRGRVFITGNTFPPKLIEPIVKAGCPQWICSRCGKPRTRITEVVGTAITEAMKIAGCNEKGEYHGITQKDYETAKV